MTQYIALEKFMAHSGLQKEEKELSEVMMAEGTPEWVISCKVWGSAKQEKSLLAFWSWASALMLNAVCIGTWRREGSLENSRSSPLPMLSLPHLPASARTKGLWKLPEFFPTFAHLLKEPVFSQHFDS